MHKEEFTSEELKNKIGRYQAELDSMKGDAKISATAEWLRIQIKKMKEILEKREIYGY